MVLISLAMAAENQCNLCRGFQPAEFAEEADHPAPLLPESIVVADLATVSR
jgi:hypothetical protein